MLKKFFLLTILLLFIKPVYAFDLGRPNNKFGIHFAQAHLEDFKAAADLVNSEGGDWGYVTLVIQENDRDKNKWQEVFDRLRELHLIPIIRLATQPDGENWKRPKKEDAESWVNFLDTLNWVTKTRYIILFNEPNHGSEWGGQVDEKNYSEIAFAFSQKLKEKSADFFVMLAGFDASSPSYPPNMEDEENFLKAVPDLNLLLTNYIDGWASHSYPNPNFAGSVWDVGRGSIRTYQWELSLLSKRGVNKDLPVFITETGWDGERLSRDTIAANYQMAFANVWNVDSRVFAVTPFVFDYQTAPFLGFSWKLLANQATSQQSFYPQYSSVQSVAKVKGRPEIIDEGSLQFDFPKELVDNSSYHLKVALKNTGQAIWDKSQNYELRIEDYSGKPFDYFFSDIKDIKPNQTTEVDLYLKTTNALGKNKWKIILYHENKRFKETETENFEIVPLPSLKFDTSLFPKFKTFGDDFELQIFDAKDELVYKKSGIRVNNGQGEIDDIQNIIPGRSYRIVLIKPYYLPRQVQLIFRRGDNKITFKSMLPFDFNKNGRLDGADFGALLKNLSLLGLFLP